MPKPNDQSIRDAIYSLLRNEGLRAGGSILERRVAMKVTRDHPYTRGEIAQVLKALADAGELVCLSVKTGHYELSAAGFAALNEKNLGA